MLDKIKEYYNNNKLLVIGFSIFILLFVCSLILIYNKFTSSEKKEDSSDLVVAVNELQNETEQESAKKALKVDIKGSVVNPGVYELEEGARVIDLVKSAGGLNTGANTDYINLSKTLENEMVIYIYSNEEIKEFYESQKTLQSKECICNVNKNDACVNIDKDNGNYIVEENNTTDQQSVNTTSDLININSGTLQDLMTLTGIGEAKAKAIIQYRNENGKFSDISEITKVSGISEAIFAKIKEDITV